MAAIKATRRPLGEILLEENLITREQLDQALEVQKTSADRLGRILVSLGFAGERDVLRAYALQLGVPLLEIGTTPVDDGVAKVLPQSLIKRYNAVPIRRTGNRLTVAMSDPSNVFALDDIRLMTGFEVEPVLASADDLEALLATDTVPQEAGMGDALSSALEDLGVAGRALGADESGTMGMGGDEEVDDGGMQLADQAPVIRVVNLIIQNAINDRASDIHVEPERRGVRIRYRVDGVLHHVLTIPRYVHPALVSRIKIMSDLNIAERRLPQDGRIHVRKDGRDYDLRVATQPTVFGEKVVMRILDQSSVLIGLSKLGLFPDTQAVLEELIVQPYGMILSTGPTGSGKTTTQYSVLNKINSVERNIITIEDPVEYQLPGINQVQVNRKAGMTFASAMRHFVRQDPDVIMVGEIRDLETAEIAVQASLTGHLVLSTLHTNDAPSSVTRMVDMGVEPFLISSSVIGVMAQRLARRICTHCREPYHPPIEAIQRVGFKAQAEGDITFYRGAGCSKCRQTGYYGRTGLYELMVLNEEIRDLIVKRAPLSEVREAALAAGMRPLKQDGFMKVSDGQTTIEEVMRVVFHL